MLASPYDPSPASSMVFTAITAFVVSGAVNLGLFGAISTIAIGSTAAVSDSSCKRVQGI